MSRLPKPGSDSGTWGDILNDYLNQEHNSDGSLKNVVRPSDTRLTDSRTPTDGSVTDAKITSGGLSPSKVTGTAVITGDSRLSPFVGSGVSHTVGLVTDPGATPGTTKFLREDTSWAVPAGSSALVLNVKDYGATGNGTTDDTVAIMATINACGQAGGGIVWFPTGTYYVATPTSSQGALLIAYDNIHLRGPGGGTAKITSHLASQGVIHVSGAAKQTGSYPSSSGNHYERRTFYKITPPTVGDTTITFSRSADAALFAAGDTMFIRTGQINGNADQDEPDSEIVEVLSVASAVVTLKEPVAKTYAQEYFAAGTATTTAADIHAGDTTVTLTNAAGFANGNSLTIIGAGTDPSHAAKITGAPSGNVITLTQAVTANIVAGATVTNGTAKTTTTPTAYPAVIGAANVTLDTLFNFSIQDLGIYNRFSTSPAIPGSQVRGFSVADCLCGSNGAFVSMGNMTDFYAGRNIAYQTPAVHAQAFFVALGPGCKYVIVEKNNLSSTAFTGIVMSEGTVHFDIDGNTISNIPGNGATDYPLNVQTRSGVGTIRGNKVLNGGTDAAIYVAQNCTRGGIIEGNIIRGGAFPKAFNIQSDGWIVGPNDLGGLLATSYTAGDTIDILSRLPGGSSLFFRADGTFATPPSASVNTVWRSSDSASMTSNTVLANDTQLLFSVGANEVWLVMARLIYSAVNTTMDIKLGWSYPVGCTAWWGAQGNQGSNIQGFGATATGSTPLVLNNIVSTLSLGTGNLTCGGSIEGMFFNGSTPGTINLEWAQNTSDAGALTMLKGSCLILLKLA